MLSRLLPGAAIAALALAGPMLGPSVAAADSDPRAYTRPASDVTDSAATLYGVVETDGRRTAYRFEYGPSPSYGALTETGTLAPGEDGPVSATVTGLSASTRYHYRLLAWHTDNPDGAVGADRTFTTAAAPAPAAAAPPPAAPASPAPAPTLPAAAAPAPTLAAPPPAPVLGQAVVVTPVGGSVRVRAPGAAGFTPLQSGGSVPVGALVDTRAGTVKLTSALDEGRTQEGEFHGALFQVRQAASGKGMTDIVLRGPALACARVRAGAATVQRRKPPVRRLWASDKGGRFRTHGRNSVTTVRGTRWVTTETCAGTRTTVTSGAVAVRDLRRGRTVVVRAGHSYLARGR